MTLISGVFGLAQEGYVHLGPYHFDAADGTTSIVIDGGGTDQESFVYRNNSSGYAYAAFEFPPEADGLLVKQITISYKDIDSDDEIGFYLRKVDLYDQSVTTVASTKSSGMSAGWNRMYINRWDMSARIIDNKRYAWYIAVDFVSNGSTLLLGNIKIKWATD